jgi:hypothetical protein
MKNIIISILLLAFLVMPCVAVESVDIDIYYPNENMTTRIYYAEGSDFNTTLANNITGNFTAVIIQNEMEYDNVIESPHKIINPVFGLIMIIILISFLILVAKLIKKVWW